MSHTYRIHGDNIIECERALALISKAFDVSAERTSTSIYMPSYSITTHDGIVYRIDLLPGHDRWSVDVKGELVRRGAPLRESTDAYITRLAEDKTSEELIFAMEYCSALPAGNNAWQRSGRAATCLEVGIPYLYFAEVGGVELDQDRQVKAERTPNPIVPFSYVSASKTLNIICLPVYQAHPAITEELREEYQQCFGLEQSLTLIKGLLEKQDISTAFEELLQKGLLLVRILSDKRRREDTIRGDNWETYLSIGDGNAKVEWLNDPSIRKPWSKKTSEKVSTSTTFRELLPRIAEISISIGAEIPICVVPTEHIEQFHAIVRELYSDHLSNAFIQNVKPNMPLLVVWINGFKPRGDDSRPDRGLVPLARMLFGNRIKLLTVVYGPAKPAMWRLLRREPDVLSRTNGLWEAVLNLSNYVLTDSSTSEQGPDLLINSERVQQEKGIVRFPYAVPELIFSEHDVDTAVHTIFSQRREDLYECLCNPPGGDWSGISTKNFQTLEEYRWTSLPRVSDIGGKRPDHVIQIIHADRIYFLVIESKGLARELEENIGHNLKGYVDALFKIAPTAHKPSEQLWTAYNSDSSPLGNYSVISGGAFNFKNEGEIDSTLQSKGLDFVMSFQLRRLGEPSILHFKASNEYNFLTDVLTNIVSDFAGWFEVQVH